MNRKKLLVVLTLLSLPIFLFAQKKGDKVYSVTGAFAAERSFYYHYPSGSVEAEPVDVSLGAGVGIGGFVEDRLFLGVGFNLEYSHIRDYSSVNMFGGQINPFISLLPGCIIPHH